MAFNPNSNRAFRYGDGLFETMMLVHGKVPLLSYHFDRLTSGMQFLKMELPKVWNESVFLQEIKKSADNLGFYNKVKVNVYRKDGGLYAPSDNGCEFHYRGTPLPKIPQRTINEIGIVPEKLLTPSMFSHLKSCNAFPYILAGIHKKKQGWDDCLILNQAGRVAEGLSSNIFIIKGDEWITPDKSEGCILGTFRQHLIKILKRSGVNLTIGQISVDDLKSADELLLTNAVYGIQPVEYLTGGKSFSIEKGTKWFNKLQNDLYGVKVSE